MNGSTKRVIAMDGPAGSGKSTVARIVADRLGFIHADSGAMYRTVTVALMRRLGAQDDHATFGAEVAEQQVAFGELEVSVALQNAAQTNLIAGQDVRDTIRSPEVTERIRYIADNRAYREAVNQLLRDFADQTDLVIDGRDIGDIVFPNTPYKFFITASAKVRARRRAGEYRDRGFDASQLTQLEQQITARDEHDMARPFGALKQAPGAILIDTSELDINGVVSVILGHLQLEF